MPADISSDFGCSFASDYESAAKNGRRIKAVGLELSTGKDVIGER